MKDIILTALLGVAVPALVGLSFTGILALLGVWKRANAHARLSAFSTASAQLESGVEAAIHGLQGDTEPLAAQLASKQLSLSAFGAKVLAALKKEGQQYIVPAVAEALGTTVSGLETLAVGLAAKKLGLSTYAAPSINTVGYMQQVSSTASPK